MFNKLELYIALRYLKSKKKEGFISVVSLFSLLGITIGVAALIIVMAVMNGFRNELTKKIVSFDGDIAIYSLTGEIANYPSIIAKIDTNSRIKNAYPMIQKQVLVSSSKDRNMGAQIRAMSIDDISKKKLISDNIIYGKLNDLSEDFTVIIGEGLASSLGVGVGHDIKIISPDSNQTVLGYIPRFKNFKVVGVFSAGMSDYDSIAIITSLKNAQLFFNMHDTINTIEIHSYNPLESNNTKFELMNDIPAYLSINDWQTKNLSFFNALKTERVVMFMILTLIIIVAAFNIISSLIMLVKDKTQDIAILRTMGIRRAGIIRIFFICGSMIGIIGTFAGVTLGVSFALNINQIKIFLESITETSLFNPVIYYLSELPAEIKFSDIISVVIMSLLLSFGATIYPAWKAASINPSEGVKR
jgi:lipoprotein-releasing system permease protein